MGCLLKEALKTLCRVNHWSYAVFWKFGCQNPKLLIWEECYYENGLSGSELLGLCRNDGAQWRDGVHLLVNEMMMDSHVVISGERLVGRSAFMGSHQWILSENYYKEAHPPKVLKELCRQFTAGMQTIAVIPVLPHGVVQFGSVLTIMENVGFVNDVTSIVLQLGSVPGVFPSEDYAAKEQAAKIGFLGCLENSTSGPNTVSCYSGLGFPVDGQTPFPFVGEFQNELRTNVAAFQVLDSIPNHWRPHETKIVPSGSLLMNGVAKAEVIPSNSEMLVSRNASSLYNPSSSAANHSMERCTEWNNSLNTGNQSPLGNKLTQNDGHVSVAEHTPCFVGNDNWQHNDAYVQAGSGDDLFDVLGSDYKNKVFGWHLSSDELAPKSNSRDKHILPCKTSHDWPEVYSTSQGNSESGIFSSSGSDNLLEAVVSQVRRSGKPSTDESVSCKTTLTNPSISAVPSNTLFPLDQSEVSGIIKGELFGFPKYAVKAGVMSSCPLRSVSFKEESGTYSQGSSINGLQLSSWIGKEKQNNSVSTGYSKKPHETSKPNRKRLKLGENPRPRPKDRQMIQDRVKELREIVPNGAKCSIDSLLERTIKHMLFMQSVVKHADKLKQTGESKVMSKDTGVTWAYEVGTQSMVCPIRVEDLNQPRQMLVEMLCEERGLFLEIADIIRGLGLTILKGIMETRDNKIWSRFTVEANRDITRMEVFISLVHLLEQSTKPGNVMQPIENLMDQQPSISPNFIDSH